MTREGLIKGLAPKYKPSVWLFLYDPYFKIKVKFRDIYLPDGDRLTLRDGLFRK